MTKPRILVAPDSFKGSVGAQQAAETIAGAFKKFLTPMSKSFHWRMGGRYGRYFKALGGEFVPTTTVESYNRPREAYWIRYGRVGFVESSQGSGFIPTADRMADRRRQVQAPLVDVDWGSHDEPWNRAARTSRLA